MNKYREARKRTAAALLRRELEVERREYALNGRPRPDQFKLGFAAGFEAGRKAAAAPAEEQPASSPLSDQLKTILGGE
jgi:hypothetical protein